MTVTSMYIEIDDIDQFYKFCKAYDLDYSEMGVLCGDVIRFQTTDPEGPSNWSLFKLTKD